MSELDEKKLAKATQALVAELQSYGGSNYVEERLPDVIILDGEFYPEDMARAVIEAWLGVEEKKSE